MSQYIYKEYKNFGCIVGDDSSRIGFWYSSPNYGSTAFLNVKIVPPVQPFHWLQYHGIYFALKILNFFRVYKQFKF